LILSRGRMFRLSIASVVWVTRRISMGDTKNGVTARSRNVRVARSQQWPAASARNAATLWRSVRRLCETSGEH